MSESHGKLWCIEMWKDNNNKKHKENVKRNKHVLLYAFKNDDHYNLFERFFIFLFFVFFFGLF